ncbi:MAG: DUF58 domain-containing protein [Phycisphaerales bacterium]|nr:DUF58 domain-containing protein [Phycisphaerales bacterium]
MLTEELMAEVRRLQIATRSIISEVFAGEYESAFKGRGLEFAEVREYQPGDDIRMIDWNVTARTGSPHIKECVEERELTVMLAVDLSSSGRFGSVDRFKNDLAAELCAVLGMVAAKGNDKVGLLIFTDHVELFIPAKKGSRHVLRVVREVLSFQPTRTGTNIALAIDHLARILKRRAVVFLVSDFLDDGFIEPLKLLARRHDVVALSIRDPRERTVPRCGLVELEDAETGKTMLTDTSSRSFRKRFAERMARDEEALRFELRRIGVDHANITTGEPYGRTLIDLFRRREGWR